MKKIFLVSDLGCSIKKDGIRHLSTIDNRNGIIDQIKQALSNNRKMVFIVSSPADFAKNDQYADFTFRSFEQSGLIFQEKILIDERYKGNVEAELHSADLLFLCGGVTKTQMQYFEKIGLRDILHQYHGVIVGQSAGAMNLASLVLCSPEIEEEIGGTYSWPGLGIVDISIEPHFTLAASDRLSLQLRKELLDLSATHPLYAICDGTHLYIDETATCIYGEAYLIHNGVITKINDTKMKADINYIATIKTEGV